MRVSKGQKVFLQLAQDLRCALDETIRVDVLAFHDLAQILNGALNRLLGHMEVLTGQNLNSCEMLSSQFVRSLDLAQFERILRFRSLHCIDPIVEGDEGSQGFVRVALPYRVSACPALFRDGIECTENSSSSQQELLP